MAEALLQGLPPVLGRHTRLVVLGSFPGAASLAARQYYAHPRNQFWPVLSALLDADLVCMPYARRLAALRQHGLGLWDVYATCQRPGSLDADISRAVLNDFAELKRRAPSLAAIAHNGAESARHAQRIAATFGWAVHRLPSTSPANASWSLGRKVAAWRDAFAAAGVLPLMASTLG